VTTETSPRISRQIGLIVSHPRREQNTPSAARRLTLEVTATLRIRDEFRRRYFDRDASVNRAL
jgi:hypothetical protein